MGIFSKLRKKESEDVLPPPPPIQKEDERSIKEPVKAQEVTVPSLPKELPPLPDDLPALDDMPPLPDEDDILSEPMSVAHEPAMRSHEESAPKPLPKEPIQALRDASDVPPIKVDVSQPVLTDKNVEDFDVDKFVLPEQAAKSQPVSVPVSSSSSGNEPMFISVKMYDDVQKAFVDLESQIGAIENDVQKVTKAAHTEDKQFQSIVNKLEKIQEDIMKIDNDLFEQ